MPDLRGLFLRGYGSQSHAQNNGSTIGVTSTTHASGALGQVQGDAMRHISGNIPGAIMFSNRNNQNSGGLFQTNYTGTRVREGSINDNAGWHSTNLDTARVTPTAEENRPANTAVRFLVRARP